MSELKIVRMKVRDVIEVAEAFSECSKVSRAENEDADIHKRFKYACGRNWERAMAIWKAAGARARELTKPSPEYVAFIEAAVDIARNYAIKDKDGNPVKVDNAPEADDKDFLPNCGYDIPADAVESHAAAFKFVAESDAVAIQAREAAIDQAQAIMDEEATLGVFCVPWAWVPEKIIGAWLQRIRVMIADLPAELDESVAVPEMSHKA